MTLDALYSAWNTRRDPDTLNDLILAVRDQAKRYFRWFGADAEDMAQDVAILILGKLPEFQPRPEARFHYWLNSILKRTKQDAWGAVKHRSSNDMVEEQQEDHDYISLAELPPGIKEIAESLLLGHSIEETAKGMGIKPGTLRKRLHSYRNR